MPYTDQPIFVPSTNHKFLERLMDIQKAKGNLADRMDGLNYAIRDTNTSIFETPGELWTQNVPYRVPLKEYEKKIYFSDSSTQLYAFHRRYWNAIICKTYLPAVKDTEEISKSNKMLFNKMYNFFNKECRVKWETGIDVWDGK